MRGDGKSPARLSARFGAFLVIFVVGIHLFTSLYNPLAPLVPFSTNTALSTLMDALSFLDEYVSYFNWVGWKSNIPSPLHRQALRTLVGRMWGPGN
jgi:hypothetical protein